MVKVDCDTIIQEALKSGRSIDSIVKEFVEAANKVKQKTEQSKKSQALINHYEKPLLVSEGAKFTNDLCNFNRITSSQVATVLLHYYQQNEPKAIKALVDKEDVTEQDIKELEEDLKSQLEKNVSTLHSLARHFNLETY